MGISVKVFKTFLFFFIESGAALILPYRHLQDASTAEFPRLSIRKGITNFTSINVLTPVLREANPVTDVRSFNSLLFFFPFCFFFVYN